MGMRTTPGKIVIYWFYCVFSDKAIDPKCFENMNYNAPVITITPTAS